MKREIVKVTLTFPHMVSIKVADQIARYASQIAQAGVSEGGFEIVGSTPCGEGMIFSEDSMHYNYGHKRDPKKKMDASKCAHGKNPHDCDIAACMTPFKEVAP